MSNDILLYRIIDGKLPYEGSYIRDPSFRIKQKGQLAYDYAKKYYEDDILEDRDIKILLIKSGKWSSEKDKKFQDLPRQIENAKVGYYQNFFKSEIKTKYKNQLALLEKEYSELFKIRMSYSNLTIDGIAATAMWAEMINYMYDGPDKVKALAYYHNNFIDENTIREIALSELWLSYTTISKNPFGKNAIRLTDYQRKLCSWSNVFRNVRSYPEPPADAILHDHAAFDGWMIFQGRKDQMEKAEKTRVKNLKPNTRNVFIGVNSAQEVEEVLAMNSPDILDKIRKGPI